MSWGGSAATCFSDWVSISGGCLERAAAAETTAAHATDHGVREEYLQLARHWRTLADSFQFCESLERFLLDADMRKASLQPEDKGQGKV
ncbi:MAG: hypothetical protein K2Y27_15950 [Xanthobacteraceae bacterium]|nr:hypothetical protein [Xanthobacteraceae bacterium]